MYVKQHLIKPWVIWNNWSGLMKYKWNSIIMNCMFGEKRSSFWLKEKKRKKKRIPCQLLSIATNLYKITNHKALCPEVMHTAFFHTFKRGKKRLFIATFQCVIRWHNLFWICSTTLNLIIKCNNNYKKMWQLTNCSCTLGGYSSPHSICWLFFWWEHALVCFIPYVTWRLVIYAIYDQFHGIGAEGMYCCCSCCFCCCCCCLLQCTMCQVKTTLCRALMWLPY